MFACETVYIYDVRVGAHSYVHACTNVNCVARASKGTLVHPNVHMGIYSWRVRVWVHYTVVFMHSYILCACLRLRPTFSMTRTSKEDKMHISRFFQIVQRHKSPFFHHVSIIECTTPEGLTRTRRWSVNISESILTPCSLASALQA